MNRFRAAAAIAAVAWLVTGCGPALVWHAHTPDRSARVRVVREHGSYYLLVGDSAGPRFDAIVGSSIVTSPDGRRIAYAARDGGKWAVVVNDTAVARWDGIGELMFTADGSDVVYSAQQADRWVVARGAVAGPPFDAILSGSIAVGPAGRAAYAARRADSVHVWIDGTVSAGWDAVATLRFDSVSGRAGYIARRGDGSYLVTEDGISGPWEAIADFAWLPDAGTAALVRDDGMWLALIGGTRYGPFDAIGALRVAGGAWALLTRSADGDRIIGSHGDGPRFDAIIPASLILHSHSRRTAYIAHTPRGMVAVAAGRAGAPAPRVRALTFSSDGEHFAYIAGYAAREHVVLDHTVIATAPVITDLLLDGCGRPAWVSHSGDMSVVHFGGRMHGYDFIPGGTLVLGDDGTSWAAVAGTRATRRLDIVIDGRFTGRRLDWNELAGELLVLDDSQSLTAGAERIVREWLRAELRLQATTTPVRSHAPGCSRSGTATPPR